jgi:hypothetical protein
MHIPVGLGHRMHICGQVVDEDLKPVMDTMTLSLSVTRPLISLEGKALDHKYISKVTDSKFCIDATYAWRLYAHLSGAHIRTMYIDVEYRGIWKDDFKWVVEKNPTLSRTPDFQSAKLAIDSADTSWGYSIGRGRYFYSESKQFSNLLLPKWIFDLNKMDGESSNVQDKDSLFTRWNKRHPNTILKQQYQFFGESWTLVQPKLLLDYHLAKRKDSLYFVPGPLVKTKFAVGRLDAPVCNFGRLPPPPAIGNPAWQDTLLVAVGDSVVIDAFYVHFPWTKIWGKATISRKIGRKGSKSQLDVSHIFAPVGETRSFMYWQSSDAYRKCLTKVESMWAGEFNTHFIGER